MSRIFIPGNVPSSKNSKVWTGRFLVHSKSVKRYIKESKRFWMENTIPFLGSIPLEAKKPYLIDLKFIRGTRHKFDYHNACQIVFDLMVEYKWIDDDNADEIIPVFSPYEYNKENPGVYITALA